MLSAKEIEQVLALGHEMRGIELKGPGLRTDSHLFAKVARAALSLGNLRNQAVMSSSESMTGGSRQCSRALMPRN